MGIAQSEASAQGAIVGGGLGTLGFMSDQRDGGVLGWEVLEFDLAEA